MANTRSHADQIFRLEEEFKAIFEQLKTASDPSERNLLLQNVNMLIQFANRLIAHEERLRKLRDNIAAPAD